MSLGSTLISGGSGFLGSHLCDRLIAMGHHVVIIDDYSSGSETNLAHLEGDPRLTRIRSDVRDELRLNDHDIRRIYHLACPASPVHYQRDPVKTITTNVIGTRNVLDLARRTGALLLLASTSEVYGDPLIHPQSEDYCGNVDPLGIRACYDEGKRCAETLCMDYHRQYRTAVKIARIFNTYGPRMRRDDGRVVSNFIVQALQGQNLTIYGRGSQTRSFCYVDDLIDGLIALMESPREVTGPINLGRPDECTMSTLAETVIRLVGTSGEIVHVPLPAGDPARRRPDIARARSVLGWNPQVPLEVGLVKTINWFRRESSGEFVTMSARHASRL